MIPICRDTGSVIAFGGRAMDAGPAAEVPELAGDADLLEGPHALRPEPDARRRSASWATRCWSRAISTSRRCFSRRRRAGRRLVRHGADAAAGAAAAPVHVEGRPQLRPRRRRPGRGGAIVRAAGRRRVRGQRRRAATGRGSRYVHPAARARTRTANGCSSSRPYLEYLLDRAAAGHDFEHDESRRQFLARCWRSRPGFRTRPRGTSLPIGSPTRRGLRKRWSGRRSGRRRSSGRPTRHDARSCPSFGQLKHAEKGLIWGLMHDPATALDGARPSWTTTIWRSWRPGHLRTWPGACTNRAAGRSYRRRFCSV